jgi:hypothetical protein
MVFRISWLGCSPESALGPYREARCTHSAGCTSIQCPSSHGSAFVILPSEDSTHSDATGSKLGASRGRGKSGSSPVRCHQCAHDRIEGVVQFGLLEAV